MEVDVQDREQVDSGEKVEARERERERERKKTKQGNNQRTLKHVTSWMACGWSEMRSLRHLEPKCECDQRVKVFEKKSRVKCENVYTPRRLQWIGIDCERNQL